MKKVRLSIVETSNAGHHLTCIEGTLINPPKVGERFSIDSNIRNSTSPVEEILSATTFRTANTTWKLEEIK